MSIEELLKLSKPKCINYYVFPISNRLAINHLCICTQCSRVYLDSIESKDYGICSIDCGMKYRGISWSDFL